MTLKKGYSFKDNEEFKTITIFNKKVCLTISILNIICMVLNGK